jgi:erythromycin esterase
MKILGLIIIATIMVSCNDSRTQIDNTHFTRWGLNNSQKIETIELTENQDDLSLLKRIVGNAEVVCLGENRHDIHEQFKLKHRFIKYLIEEMNFTVFVLEASLPYSKKINDYVLNGNGNIDEIMSGMPGWFLWDTQEIKSILIWIRKFNKNPDKEKKVKFYGVDIVAPNNALDQIFEYLQKVDQPFFKEIQNNYYARDIINDNNWPTSLQHYSELSDEEKLILDKNYNALYKHIKQSKAAYVSVSTETEYDWILQLAYSANEANKMFSVQRRLDIGLIRDNAMAQNTLWVKQSLQNEEKMIVWAHNVHIGKGEFTMTGEEGTIKGMGYILNQKLQKKMVSIGASFNQGEFQNENRVFQPSDENTVARTLANLKMSYLLLDLNGKTKDENIKKWLNTTNTIHGQNFEMTCVPKNSFDAMYFIDKISKVQYNKTTLKRFNN